MTPTRPEVFACTIRGKPHPGVSYVESSFGPEDQQAANLIVEGENLHAMVSLYKYRGQVDLILTDPLYNTGADFRYNDKWDEDPNDPDLGAIVPAEDGSRHSKWLRFMVPRVWAMREMLRPSGVLAVCIDHRELFRLGMVLDEIFGEANRIGIINWQKSYAPRNDQKHLSAATEYVLVYTKNLDRAKTGLLPRTETMNARYLSPDGDPERWKPGDLTAQGDTSHPSMVYAVQSPFTGELHYPSEGRHWASEKRKRHPFRGGPAPPARSGASFLNSALSSSTAWAVVPEPAKGSKTIPSGWHQIWMILRRRRSGFTVSNPCPRPIMALRLVDAGLAVPRLMMVP